MCGLAGTAGDLSDDDLAAFSYIAGLASLRGMDSTGFMDFRNKGKFKDEPRSFFIKTVSDSQTFYSPQGPYFNDIVSKYYQKHNPIVQACHARAATVGKILSKNAHPFNIGDILGMHNGTIRLGLKDQDKFETDSECLFDNLAKDGDKFLQDLTDMNNSAYALVWIDKKEKTLNFFRNDQRQLFMYKSMINEKIFWASDRNWLAGTLPYFKYDANMISMVPTNTKISFPLENEKVLVSKAKETVFQKTHFFREVEETTTGKEWNKSSNLRTGTFSDGTNLSNILRLPLLSHSPQDGKIWSYEFEKYMTQAEVIQARKEKDETPFDGEAESVKTLRPTFGEIYVTQTAYLKIMDNGCSGCSVISSGKDKVEFIDHDAYICDKCCEDAQWREVVLADYLKGKLEEYNKNKSAILNVGEEVTCH